MTDQVAKAENDELSRTGMDFDGLCHDADGAGKVQCMLLRGHSALS